MEDRNFAHSISNDVVSTRLTKSNTVLSTVSVKRHSREDKCYIVLPKKNEFFDMKNEETTEFDQSFS